MSRTACRSAASLVSLVVALVCLTLGMAGQSGTRDVEWRTYGADLGHSKYRPLDQINASNFNQLEIAWRFTSGPELLMRK